MPPESSEPLRPRTPPPIFAALCLPDLAAQVLAAARPFLQGRPFAVLRQDRHGHNTQVFSRSPEAAALGIAPGTPVPWIRRKFPRLPLLPRDEAGEEKALGELEGLLYAFTPDFRLRGEGAAVLDLTGTPVLRELPPLAAGARIQARIRSALGFRCIAVGLASRPLSAQILARSMRPDGVRFCPAPEEEGTLAGLPAVLLPGLSPAARETLKKYAITALGQLLGLGRESLRLHFGKEGERIHALAAGLDLAALPEARERIESTTFLERDRNDADSLRALLRLTVDRLVFRLRKEEGLTDRFTLEILYGDNRSQRKTFTCPRPTFGFDSLLAAVLRTFEALYTRRVALKAVRLIAQRPKPASRQLDLFWTPQEAKQEALAHALDRIRSRHDFGAVLNGSTLAE